MEYVHTEKAPHAIGPYSQATVQGGLIYSAGQVALDPSTGALVDGDVRAQTTQALRNLAAVLDAAGASMSQVVKTTVFLTDMADFPAMNAAYAEAFGEHKPARSTVAVAGLPLGARVEIEVIAAR